MKKILGKLCLTAVALSFAGEAMATEWNVSLWGKRRAFTEHVEKSLNWSTRKPTVNLSSTFLTAACLKTKKTLMVFLLARLKWHNSARVITVIKTRL